MWKYDGNQIVLLTNIRSWDNDDWVGILTTLPVYCVVHDISWYTHPAKQCLNLCRLSTIPIWAYANSLASPHPPPPSQKVSFCMVWIQTILSKINWLVGNLCMFSGRWMWLAIHAPWLGGILYEIPVLWLECRNSRSNPMALLWLFLHNLHFLFQYSQYNPVRSRLLFQHPIHCTRYGPTCLWLKVAAFPMNTLITALCGLSGI